MSGRIPTILQMSTGNMTVRDDVQMSDEHLAASDRWWDEWFAAQEGSETCDSITAMFGRLSARAAYQAGRKASDATQEALDSLTSQEDQG